MWDERERKDVPVEDASLFKALPCRRTPSLWTVRGIAVNLCQSSFDATITHGSHETGIPAIDADSHHIPATFLQCELFH